MSRTDRGQHWLIADPVWTSSIRSNADFALAVAAFALLVHGRLSPMLVVALAALAGMFLPR